MKNNLLFYTEPMVNLPENKSRVEEFFQFKFINQFCTITQRNTLQKQNQ